MFLETKNIETNTSQKQLSKWESIYCRVDLTVGKRLQDGRQGRKVGKCIWSKEFFKEIMILKILVKILWFLKKAKVELAKVLIRKAILKTRSTIVAFKEMLWNLSFVFSIVCTPPHPHPHPHLSAGHGAGGGGETPTKFSKRGGGLGRTSNFRGGC